MALCAGCTRPPERVEWVRHPTWSSQVRQVPFSTWPDVTHMGLGVGFVRPEDRDTHPYERPSIDQFHIQSGDPFTVLLLLSANYEEPYPVLVSFFLDYQQVLYSLDDQQGVLHYVEIPPGVLMEIPVAVPIETPGWHDLFVVAFREPENHSTDPEIRLPPSFGVGGFRTVVCVEDCTLPTQVLPDVFTGKDVAASRMPTTAFPVSPDDGRPAKRRLLSFAYAEPGAVFPLELWARNTHDQVAEYVVLPLLAFQQVPFAGTDVLHLYMPPGSELFVPGQIQVPDESGIYEFQFVTIFEPYQLRSEVTDPFVSSDMRSAIIVESDS